MIYFNFQPKVSRRSSADHYSHHRNCISNWKHLTIGRREKIKRVTSQSIRLQVLSDIVWGTDIYIVII